MFLLLLWLLSASDIWCIGVKDFGYIVCRCLDITFFKYEFYEFYEKVSYVCLSMEEYWLIFLLNIFFIMKPVPLLFFLLGWFYLNQNYGLFYFRLWWESSVGCLNGNCSCIHRYRLLEILPILLLWHYRHAILYISMVLCFLLTDYFGNADYGPFIILCWNMFRKMGIDKKYKYQFWWNFF